MAPLDAAVALAEVDAVALAVGEHLDLDVARRADVLLHVDGAVAERRLGLGLSLTHGAGQLGGLLDDADALAAAAGRRLDHHRQADVAGDDLGLGGALDDALGAGRDGHAGGGHRRPRRRLVAHELDALRRRADELDALLAAEAAELGALGEEPVAGVDGLGAALQRRLDERRHDEVALRGRRRPDADGLVGVPDVQAVGVGLAVHGDRAARRARGRRG